MDSLKRNSMLGLGILLLVISLLSGCGSKSSTYTTTYSSPPTTTLPPTTTIQPTTTPPPTTTQSSFPYQGSGSGTWSGQIIYNGVTYNIAGTMIVACDSKGVFTGTIFSPSGGAADTQITAQVDPNGNLAGSVSFVVASITFVTTWQGKITVSGNALSLQGTWTSLYGSGTFSGTGTSSK